jgi:site-specific recombinase XerD
MLLITKGVDILTISRLLGHSKLTTTMGYARILDEHKTEAIAKLASF